MLYKPTTTHGLYYSIILSKRGYVQEPLCFKELNLYKLAKGCLSKNIVHRASPIVKQTKATNLGIEFSGPLK